MPHRRAVHPPPPPPPVPEAVTTVLALLTLGAERAAVAGRWVVSRSALVVGVLGQQAHQGARIGWHWAGTSAAPTIKQAARKLPAKAGGLPGWVSHCLVILLGLWLAGTSALTALRAAIGPESGADVLSATSPAMLALVLASAAVLLSLHRVVTGVRSVSAVALLLGSAVALGLG